MRAIEIICDQICDCSEKHLPSLTDAGSETAQLLKKIVEARRNEPDSVMSLSYQICFQLQENHFCKWHKHVDKSLEDELGPLLKELLEARSFWVSTWWNVLDDDGLRDLFGIELDSSAEKEDLRQEVIQLAARAECEPDIDRELERLIVMTKAKHAAISEVA